MNRTNLKENSINRLKKEKEFYEKEIKDFETKLASMNKVVDIYNKRLIEDQIDETKKALEMVNARLMELDKPEL